MGTNAEQLFRVQELVLSLSREDQLLVVQAVLADIRKAHFTDHGARNRELAEDFRAILAYESAQANKPHPEPTRAAG